MQLAAWMHQRFAGRDDIYGDGMPDEKKPSKNRYPQKIQPVTEGLMLAHLTGAQTIGIYPIRANRVRWFAVDFDGPKTPDGSPHPEAFRVAWADAEDVAQKLEAAGLVVYLERSRTGQGVHLWGFLDDWTPAADVIDAVKPLAGDKVTYDRILPLQKAVHEGGSGNLIALPWQGAAAPGNAQFLNRDTLEPIDPASFIEQLELNYGAVIARVAAENRKRMPAERERPEPGAGPSEFQGRPVPLLATGILKMVSKYGCRFMHHVWVHHEDRSEVDEPMWYAALGQFSAFQHGEAAARIISTTRMHEWDKWANVQRHPPVGCANIHDRFANLACAGCPMKAPYYTASKPLHTLVTDAGVITSHAEFDDDLIRIRRRNEGRAVSGVPMGIAGLDKYARLRPGELTTFGAQSSIGKTAFLVHLAIALARQGVPVVVVEAEMEKDPLHDRLIAHVAEVDSRALKGERHYPVTPEEWVRVERAVAELKTLPLYENYNATQANQVLEVVETAVLEHGVHPTRPYVVMFDFLQFADKDKGEQEQEKIARSVYEFKSLAKLLSQSVVIYSQLTRDAEGTDEPKLTDFRGSGKIEIHTNLGLIMTGERIDGPKAPRAITIVKQTDGPVGMTIEYVLEQTISKFVAQSEYTAQGLRPADALVSDARADEYGQWTHTSKQ